MLKALLRWLGTAGLGVLLACDPSTEGTAIAPEGEACGVAWDGVARKQSVIVVLSDTLRADRVASAGGPARTPAWDELAASALHFRDAHSTAPWTKPAVASLFTGLYPSQHGVLTHPELQARGSTAPAAPTAAPMTDGLATELTTLAELFNEAGYATAGIVANPWLGEAYGFSQGFEHYDHSHAGNDTPGENITAAALDWLATREDERPFLLYLHYMDAHGPYLAIDEERFTAAEAELRADQSPLPPKARRTIARFSRDTEGRGLLLRGIPASRRLAQLAYDGGVEQFDAALGALLEGLPEALGADSDAVALVVTSDHGESLYERGRGGHGNSLYREDVAIPLALRLPGLPPSQVDCPVSLIDVMATLVRYTGIAPSDHDHGRPLLLAGDETGSGGMAVSEAVIRRPGERSLVTRDYRVIHRPTHGDADPPWSWFAREPDPLETADLTAGPGGEPVPEGLARTLETAVPDWTGTAATRVPMDAETRDRLEALGYLGGEEE